MSDPGFVRELRRLLQHLYDPLLLRQSSLVELFAVDRDDSPASLQHIVVQAIQRLKPAASVSPQANAWRIYRTLSHRYIDQFSQQEVAIALGLSIRQMRRLESLALRTLADFLWNHYELQQGIPPQPAAAPCLPSPPPSREQELQWLERSLPSEVVEAEEVIRPLLAVAAPLAEALGVRVQYDVADGLPRLAVQPASVRQALLNLLTAAIRAAPAAKVDIAARACGQQVRIAILSVGQAPAHALRQDQADNVEMARQLLALSGGCLEVPLGQDPAHAFRAELVLPAVEQAAVLVIDDNADTLQLFQRYLTGTRYPFIGTREPEQALALAEKLAPRVVVLDVMLPGVDGWELLGRLRTHPKTRAVPVIVCTILPQEQLALALGAAAFLRKPVSREDLLAALDRQLAPGAQAAGEGR